MDDTERRAIRAQELLSDPLIVEAFETLEREYHDAWAASKPEDADGRERAYLHLRVLDSVKWHLQSVVNKETLSRKQKKSILHERNGIWS